MKKLFFIILIPCLIYTGCSSSAGEGDKRVVAQVNKYKMSIEDLKYELRNVPYDEKGLLKTNKGRREYMDRLVEKEILLQEAQHLGLDKERDFMKSIENYWEQALLKSLLQRKSKEISGLIHVYENEIEDYYKTSGEELPLSKVRPEIRRAIRQKKETKAMDAWIQELKKKSYIKIDEDLVRKILSKNKKGGTL